MALTKIQAQNIQNYAIDTNKLANTAVAAFAQSLAPKVTTVNVANSSYTVLDDTAVNTGGGYIVVTGSDFQSGAVVLVDTTQATSTTFVNSTTLRAQLPSKSAGTYNVYVANPDGGVGIKLNGVNYSASPIWVTTSPLANVTSNTAFTGSLSATGATSYANTTELPTGMTLVGANGYYYGTISVSSDTTYSFTINATDAENQDSPATFNLTAVAVLLDTYFNSTTLLLTGNGTNNANNNVFQDSSSNNFAITRNGNTTQGTFSPFSPTGWSNYFDGTGDYLTLGDNATLRPDSGNFTLECWMYIPTDTSSTYFFASKGWGAAGGWGAWTQGSELRFRTYDASLNQIMLQATGFTYGAWNHIAVVRNSNVITGYINGVSGGTISNSVNLNNTSELRTGEAVIGYISNLRLVKGTAVYTSNFTPSTTPLTAITNTSLLTCQSNRFIDNSTNNFAITRNGDVSVQAFSPFAPAAAYSPTTHGGSGYFDGTGDFLSVNNDASLQLVAGTPFCIEAWVYPESSNLSTDNGIIGKRAGGNEWQFNIHNSFGGINFWNGSTTYQGNFTMTSFEWQHVAVTWDGTTMRFFRNGVMGTTHTGVSFASPSTNQVNIGALVSNGAAPFTGKISGLRLVKGSAVYTSAFTPPTSPVTAIANTSLLLNYTNAGIVDSTAKNVIETVGDAKVNTAVKKYGTGSMYFDGTGDYLTLRPGSLDLGSGDFTVEFWMYSLRQAALNSNNYAIIEGEYSGSGLLWGLSTSSYGGYRGLTFTYGVWASYTVGKYTSNWLGVNVWQHIAVTRQGSTWRIFVDGVSQGLTTYNENGTFSDTTDFTNSTGIRYIGGAHHSSPFYGHIDDLRITKGVARYTSNFTPPTAELPIQ